MMSSSLAMLNPSAQASSGADSAMHIQKVTSASGIEAWLVEDHSLPLISMNFAFKGGTVHDPDDRSGLTSFMAGLLDEGAGDFDSLQFQTALEDRSIQLSFDASRDAFYGQLRFVNAEMESATQLAHLALTKPRFDEEPMDRIRAKIIAQLRHEARDPDHIANRALLEALFPEHPYSRDGDGTEESLALITRDDLIEMHRNMLAQDNLFISVVGSISPERLSAMLDTLFQDLPKANKLAEIPLITPKTDQIITIQEAVPQSVMRFAAPAPLRQDDDFIPAFIANHILGGGAFSSRLYQEVREKRGLTYSVYSYVTDFDHAGLYIGGVATRNDRMDESLDVILEEINKMGADGPDAEELTKAKQYLIGSYPLRFDTSGKIARQLVEIQLADLGIDYIDRRNQLIADVSLEEVQTVAKEIFSAAPTIIKVGQITDDE